MRPVHVGPQLVPDGIGRKHIAEVFEIVDAEQVPSGVELGA
jgi:hypothetical protein